MLLTVSLALPVLAGGAVSEDGAVQEPEPAGNAVGTVPEEEAATSALLPPVAVQEPNVPEGYRYGGLHDVSADGTQSFYVVRKVGDYGTLSGMWIDADGNEVPDPRALPQPTGHGPKYSAASLPTSYDARKDGLVTSVKDQIGGTCWAHAVIGALESNAIKQGLADSSVDLSEYHMAWNGINGYYPGVEDSKNDGLYYPDEVLDGGNTYYAELALLYGLCGAIYESTIPLTSTGEYALEREMSQKYTYDTKFLRDVTLEKIVGADLDDIAEIKSMLLEYGALYLSYYDKDSAYSASGTAYYNPNFRIDDPSLGGHAVLLVGWDDNFSRNNFRSRPSRNGAWLIKNSWGSSWGDGGYFWMSYDEKSIDEIAAVVAAPAEEYQTVFRYDSLGWSISYRYDGAANVFHTDGDISLSKVSYGRMSYATVKVDIYRLKENYKNPVDGDCLYSGRVSFSGELYADLPEEVALKAGDTFSVVITGVDAYVEGENDSYSRYTSNAGESWVRSGSTWTDCGTVSYMHNVCIRAVGHNTCSHIWAEIASPERLVHAATCVSKAVYKKSCELCGIASRTETFEYGDLGDHSFTGSAYRDNGDGTHSRKCAYCAAYNDTPEGCKWQKTGSSRGANCQNEGADHYQCPLCRAKKDVPNGQFGDHTYRDGECVFCGQEKPASTGLAAIFASIINAIRNLFKTLFGSFSGIFS